VALLAHGYAGSKETLFRYGEALAAAGFICYSVDQPGHEASPKKYHFIEAVHTLEAVAREIGPVDVFAGQSMGMVSEFSLRRGSAVNMIRPMAVRFPNLLSLSGFAICLFAGVFPAASNTALPRYGAQSWGVDDGLPHNSIHAITQTRDGYLWLATPKGLVRFDGVRFTVFDPGNTSEIKGHAINALCATRDGSLLFGGYDTGLVRWDGRRFSRFTRANGLCDDSIKTIIEDREGSVWVGTTNGLARFRDGIFSNFSTNDGLASTLVSVLWETRKGELLIAAHSTLQCFKEGMIRDCSSPDVARGRIRALAEDADGTIWIGSHGGLQGIKQDETTWYQKGDLPDNIVSAFCGDRDGVLWIGTYSGLICRVNGELRTPAIDKAIPQDVIYTVFEDREGSLWIGAKDGLHRLNPKVFRLYTREDGLTHHNVISVLETHPNLWIGTWGGGLNLMKDDGSIVPFPPKQRGPKLVLALHQSRAGEMWFGFDLNHGLFHWKDGTLTPYAEAQGLTDRTIRVVHEDREGTLWLGTSTALVSFRDGKFTRYTTKEGLAGNTVRVIHETKDGTIWIGSNDGLSLRRDGKFANFTTAHGLSHNAVVAIHEDDEGALWLGTAGGGLIRFKVQSLKFKVTDESRMPTLNVEPGTLNSFTTKDGLFSDDVYEILEDDYGYFWMGSSHGVFRVSRQNLIDFGAGRVGAITNVSFGKSDGLGGVTCSSVGKPGAWKDRTGRLWFATAKGLAMVDSQVTIRRNDLPPPVVIEEVMADKRKFDVSSLKFEVSVSGATSNLKPQTLNLNPGRGELEFHYAALSFVSPEKNRFKYRLEGYDLDWVDAGARRQAHYNKVPPGRYTFRVRACNNDGTWNDEGASLALVWQPHFWQQHSFRGGVAACALLLAWTGARYFTRRKLQRQIEMIERQHSLERERARIAQDIHDDLGAGLTRITMLSDLTQEDHDRPQEVQTHTRKISSTARDMVRALDEIVWAVTPRNDTLKSLVEYFGLFADEFIEDSVMRCRIERPLEIPHRVISSEVRHNLFLVFKETLNNAMKYSGGSEIKVQISILNGQLKIVMADNGRGFDVASRRGAGNGLENMQRRMEEIGGNYELSSAPGQGVQTILSAPLR
jgi:ligand-binding sensor domain-containing protein/signal transduction histidine kinase